MAPRRTKDSRRAPSDVAKDEPISETASSAMGDDVLAFRKKRGRPRKSAAFDRDGDEQLEGAEWGDDGAASSGQDDDYEDEEEKGAAPAIARAAGFSVEQRREAMKKGARRAAPLQQQQTGKDGGDLQNELLMMRCLHGRGSHRRKGKPTRAAQASF